MILTSCAVVDGKTCLPGMGPMDAQVMFIFSAPFPSEMKARESFTDGGWDELYRMCKEAGIGLASIYRTYAVKFLPDNMKKLKASELKAGAEMLKEEIETIKPKVIVLFGVDLVKIFFGRSASIGQFDGAIAKSELYPDIAFICLCQPAYVLRYPESRPTYVDNLRKVLMVADGSHEEVSSEYTEIVDVLWFQDVVNEAIESGGIVSLDCEWEGDYPDFPGAFIRTVQFRIRYDNGMQERTYILPLAQESTEFAEVPGFSDQIAVKVPAWGAANEKIVISYLKQLLESPKISIVGQNVREDGKWLLMLHGIDIRPNTLYDTMLAEHCINSMGPFGLEVLTCKYTTLGRYDTPLEQWKLANPNKCERGYASIPDSVLLPYAAFDVLAPLLIMDAQIPKLSMYMQPRGEYPSVFEGDMGIARLLYELETVGMLVDPVQLGKLTTIYHAKRQELLKPVQEKVFERYLISNFNPGSHKQMVDLLFNKMKLAPIKTTGKPSKTWEWVQRQRPEVQAKYSPSTDGDTLEILAANGDDLLQDLLDYGKVSTICKNFLRNDKQGGIPGNTHPDGRLHARFSQLSETARFKHSDPNVANFPKAAEGDLGKIICKGQEEQLCELLGKDEKGKPVIGVRSVVVADEGHIFVEGDFKQAELVTLGSLSEDPVYMSLLNTPGKDLHDRTTIDSFRLKVYHYDGSEYSMDEMATIAVSDKELYEWMMKQLVYVRPNGERLTRSEFKDTLRVAGKAIGFGYCF